MNTLIRLKPVLLIFAASFCLSSVAQLSVDAGDSLIVCSGDNAGEYSIGGAPSATGGVEPYTYSWSGKHFDLKYPSGKPMWIFASDIMDDTTKSNPVIKDWRNVREEWTTYYLKVEDAADNVQVDSVKIIRSVFWVHPIYKLPKTIYRGDSVCFFGDIYFINDFLPLKYSLSPSYGLTDTTDIYGWAKPDTSVTYYLQAVNSLGCVSEKIPYWEIEVIDTTTNIFRSISFENSNLQFFPNPATNQITISNPSNIQIKRIEIIDFSGRIIKKWEAQDLVGNKLNFGNLLPGIYLLNTETASGIKTEKLIIQ